MPPQIYEDSSSEYEEEILESPPRKVASTVQNSVNTFKKPGKQQSSSVAKSNQQDALTSDYEGSSSSSTPPTSVKYSTLTPRLSTTSTPKLQKGLNTDNIVGTPPKRLKFSTPESVEYSTSDVPKPRKTRALIKGHQPVNYDMKYHPMDEFTRPAQAARHALQFPGTKSTANFKKRRTSRGYANASLLDKEMSPEPDDKKNPFTEPIPDDWHDFNDYDRRVYILQKGAPVDGNTLPIKWLLLVNVLIGENHFTKQQLKAWGGLKVIKERYEKVRLSLQVFWKAGEEAKNVNDFAVMYVEGFDVYDLSGSKTKYHQDNKVADPSRKTQDAILPEKAVADDREESVDEEENQSDVLAGGGSEVSVDFRGGEEHVSNEIRDSLMPFIDGATLEDDEELSHNEDLRRGQRQAGFTALNHDAAHTSQQPPLNADRQFELDLSETLEKVNAAHDRQFAEGTVSRAHPKIAHARLMRYETVFNEFIQDDEPPTHNGRHEPPMNSTKQQHSSREGRSKGSSGAFKVFEDPGPSPKRPRFTKENKSIEDDPKENHDAESQSESGMVSPQRVSSPESPPPASQEQEVNQPMSDIADGSVPIITAPKQDGTSDEVRSPSTVGTVAYEDESKVFMTPRSTKIEYTTPKRFIRSPSMPDESPVTTRTGMLDMFGARSSEQQIAAQKASRDSKRVSQ
ncbi:MAG: hypothetical protein M1812_000827 [Candelaria pacifica]|nr:MAG: hypothetical protein M1812_000827 [Candelaria pacifica]